MSADLWAAFGASDDLSSNPWTQQPSSTQVNAQKDYEVKIPDAAVDSSPSRAEVKAFTEEQSLTPWATSEGLSSIYKPPASQTLKLEPWNTLGKEEDAWSGWESPSVSADNWANTNATLNVLSSTVLPTQESVDDWGDFETPEVEVSRGMAALSTQERSKWSPKPHTDLPIEKSTPREAPKARQKKGLISGDYDPNATSDLGSLSSQQSIATTLKESEVTISRKPNNKPDLQLVDEVVPYSQEEWGEFSPEPSSAQLQNVATTMGDGVNTPNMQSLKPKKTPSKDTTHMKQVSASRAVTSASALPPSNVPPPSILISLVSGLVEKLPLQVENAMQSLSESGGPSRVLETALRKCIASLRVAARITAGRKLRWKRDTHLAQSMRIGQAGKGMKLSGVDRNEVKKEDREAAEFVDTWQKRLGSIRRALALVNSQVAGSPLALPEIAETMAVRAIKVVNGGVLAPKCCVLCGIKREERVDKVDVDVYDAFSEWWTDHWGHTECKMFWIEHERYLNQR